MNELKLKKILAGHALWFHGDVGRKTNLRSADLRSADLSGASLRSANLRSADLSGASLRSADLRSADLRNADLSGADLRGVDLSSADIRNANLRSADLRNANLSGADLSGSSIFNTIGNKIQIKTISIDRYIINYTEEVIQIGCEQHKIDDWLNFDDETIKNMDFGAFEWWRKWKGFIFMAIEMSPAES